MSTGRLLLLFTLLMTLVAVGALFYAAVTGIELGTLGTGLMMFATGVFGWLLKSPVAKGGELP